MSAPEMTRLEFMRSVLPAAGPYVISTLPPGTEDFENHFFDTIEAAGDFANAHRQHTNVYFGVHSFKTKSRRTKENAKAARCLYIDLDVGEEEHKNPSREAAIVALMAFCPAVGLPKPMIVSSGVGFHLYWRLTEDVPSTAWKIAAEKLKRLAKHVGLKTDEQVTADAARVLRVPGTKHLKDPANPLDVVVLAQGASPRSFADIEAILDSGIAAIPVGKPHRPAGVAPVPEVPENIAAVEAMLACISPDVPRKIWLKVVFAVLATGWTCAGRSAREWSLKGAKWSEVEFDKLVRSFKPDGRITVGTLIHIAHEHGYAGPGLVSTPAAANDHAWPDPKPLPSGLPPVEPFDPAMVPEAVAPWIMDVAERMQCPPDFVAVTVMVALGAVLGRKVAIRPQRRTDWFEVANLWGCIVGRPGAMKSPAMKQALAPLDRLEAEARRSNAEALSGHAHAIDEHKIRREAAMKAARNGGDLEALVPPEQPKLKRYTCNDTTYEALGAILADNPNGVLVYRDELVSLLKTLDREEYAAARGFYLTAWNGTSGYTFDRIMRGLTHIDAACLSLVGSTQPGKLAAYVGRAVTGGPGDDGLIQRFGLLIWPDDNGVYREVDRYPDSDARDAAFGAFIRLDALTPADVEAEQGDFDALPFLRFNDVAADLFASWRADLETRLRAGLMHSALESHLAKYRKLVPALALLNHLADNGTGPVPEIAMRRALKFAAYLESHARRAYSSGQQAEVAAAKAILSRIRKGDLVGEFSARDVLRHEWSNLSNREQVAAGLDLLDDLGWLRSRRLDTGGRPKCVFTPNPRAVA